jgi:hypothetical protein
MAVRLDLVFFNHDKWNYRMPEGIGTSVLIPLKLRVPNTPKRSDSHSCQLLRHAQTNIP